VFEGDFHGYRFIPILGPQSNLYSRLVRPHKVSAVRERYAAYGNRVEIGPVEDIIKGDLTDALKGAYQTEHKHRNLNLGPSDRLT